MHFAHKPSAFVAFSRSGHFTHNLCQGINRGLSTSAFEVDYFYDSMIRPQIALNALVVNQRFLFDDLNVTQQQANDSNAMQHYQSTRIWSGGQMALMALKIKNITGVILRILLTQSMLRIFSNGTMPGTVPFERLVLRDG
jgi:hypothetical protein